MAHVDLSFTPLTGHVRTARLVTMALARRAGIEDDLVDELRLAVGEACARAVSLHLRHAPESPVTLQVSIDRQRRFCVSVTDSAPAAVDDDDDGPDEALVGPMGLALLTGLVDDLDIVTLEGAGTRVTMRWDLPPDAPGLPLAAAGSGAHGAPAVLAASAATAPTAGGLLAD